METKWHGGSKCGGGAVCGEEGGCKRPMFRRGGGILRWDGVTRLSDHLLALLRAFQKVCRPEGIPVPSCAAALAQTGGRRFSGEVRRACARAQARGLRLLRRMRGIAGFTAGLGVWFLAIWSGGLAAAAAPIERSDARLNILGSVEALRWEDGGAGEVARVRRRRPGGLGFGTFEAWCQGRVRAEGLSVPPAGVGEGGVFVRKNLQNHALYWNALERAGAREFQAARTRVPPSLGAVVRYFEEALGEAPVHEDAGRFRFERWEGFAWGASWRRCLVSGGGGSVCLEWWANDDFGVSELREFFEAPFFELSESMVFHQWLGFLLFINFFHDLEKS